MNLYKSSSKFRGKKRMELFPFSQDSVFCVYFLSSSCHLDFLTIEEKYDDEDVSIFFFREIFSFKRTTFIQAFSREKCANKDYFVVTYEMICNR